MLETIFCTNTLLCVLLFLLYFGHVLLPYNNILYILSGWILFVRASRALFCLFYYPYIICF